MDDSGVLSIINNVVGQGQATAALPAVLSQAAQSGTTPDQEAEWQRLARESNVPVGLIRNGAPVKLMQLQQQAADLPAINPVTARTLMDPDNAAVAHDDIGTLTRLEDLARNGFGSQANTPVSALQFGTPRDQAEANYFAREYGQKPYQAIQGGTGKLATKLAFPVAGAVDAVNGDDDYKEFASQLYDAFDAIQKQSAADPSQGFGGKLFRSLEELAPMVLSGGAGLGNIVGQAVNEKYDDLTAKGVDPDTATALALKAGMSAYAMTKLPFGGTSLTNSLVRGATLNPAFGVLDRALDKAGLKYVGYDRQADTINLTDPEQIAHDMALGLVFGAQHAIETGRPIVGNSILETMLPFYDTYRAGSRADALQAIGDTVQQSRLNGRDPDLLQQHLQQVGEENGIDQVYVPVNRWNTLFQDAGMDPAAAANDLLSNPESYHEANRTGADIPIPYGEYTGRLSGLKDVYPELVKDTRLGIGDATLREAEEAKQALADQTGQGKGLLDALKGMMGKSVDETTKTDSSAKVYNDLYDQQLQTGTERSQADTNARLMSNVFRVLGERAGVDPYELYRQYNLRLTGPDQQGDTTPGALFQSAANDLAGNGVNELYQDSTTGSPEELMQKYGTNEQSYFGPVWRDLAQNAKGAVERLSQHQTGEAIGALHHPDVGNIDLVWGKEGTPEKEYNDGYGLAKIKIKHPEVAGDLQNVLDSMSVVSRSKNRIRLESDDHQAVVRLDWDGKKKQWLLTEFEKDKEPGTGKTTGASSINESDSPIHQALIANILHQDSQNVKRGFIRFDSNRNFSKPSDVNFLLQSAFNDLGGNGVRELYQSEKPVVSEITGKELGDQLDSSNVIGKARNYFKEHLQGQTITRDGFGDVRISGKGWEKLRRGFKTDLLKAQLIPAIPDIIKKGEYHGREELCKPRKDDIAAFHFFTGHVDVDGKKVETGVTVAEDTRGNLFYHLNHDTDALWSKLKAPLLPGSEARGAEPSEGDHSSTFKEGMAPSDGDVNIKIFYQDGATGSPEELMQKYGTDEQSYFGPVWRDLTHNDKGAIERLKQHQTGEAIGALHHPDFGDIDLVWGKEGTGKSDGYGLVNILKYHPEVTKNLQDILSDMKIVSKSENKAILESEKYKATLRLEWDGQAKQWLLTAFQKRTGDKTTTDTLAFTGKDDTASLPTDSSLDSIINSKPSDVNTLLKSAVNHLAADGVKELYQSACYEQSDKPVIVFKDGVNQIDIKSSNNIEKGTKIASMLPRLDVDNLFDTKKITPEEAVKIGMEYYRNELEGHPVKSPAFNGEEVSFTDLGLSHVMGEHERALSPENIARRMKLLAKAREVIANATFADEVRVDPDGNKYGLLGVFKDGTVLRVVVQSIVRDGKVFLTTYDWKEVGKKLKQSPSPELLPSAQVEGVGEAPPSADKRILYQNTPDVKGEGYNQTSEIAGKDSKKNKDVKDAKHDLPDDMDELLAILKGLLFPGSEAGGAEPSDDDISSFISQASQYTDEHGNIKNIDSDRNEATASNTPVAGDDHVKKVVTGVLHSAITKIKTPADAAHIAFPLTKRAQEAAIAIVTDAKGNVLGVIQHSTGSLESTPMTPRDLLGVVHDFPGAAEVWFAHNHPSGDPSLSPADREVTSQLAALLDGSGIKSRGQIVVGQRGGAVWTEGKGGKNARVPLSSLNLDKERNKKIKTYEREIIKLPSSVSLFYKKQTVDYARSLGAGASGIIVVDTKIRPVSFVPMSLDDMGKLKTGELETGSSSIMSAFHKANGAGMILVAPVVSDSHAAIRNMASFNDLFGGILYDVIETKSGRSFREEGRIPEGSGLFFQGGNDKRGYIRFDDTRNFEIGLLKDANLSTFIHESGHFFTEVLGDLAERPDAPRQIRDDYAALLEFAGVNSRDAIQTEHHEKLARAFEAYIKEGNAPSVEMHSLFQRMKAWMIGIYKDMTALNVQLNPEIRDVFDRMLATDTEIERMRDMEDMKPLFAAAEDAGMSQAEFELYRKDAEQAGELAKEQLLRKLMAEKAREQKQWWKDERKKTWAEVEDGAKDDPIYQTYQALTAGKTFDGRAMGDIKLSREALVKQYGEEFVKNLPREFRRVYAKEGGLHPDAVAEMAGFGSGDEMVRKMAAAPKLKDYVKAETDRRMRERYGDMMTDGSIREQALKDVHNDAQGKVMRTELLAIQRKTREGRAAVKRAEAGGKADAEAKDAKDRAERDAMVGAVPPIEFFKIAAAETMSAKRVADIQPRLYAYAARQAARESFDATARGDYVKAGAAKYRELLNHYLYKEAAKARDYADKVQSYANRMGTMKELGKCGQDGGQFLDQIRAILNRYGFDRISNKEADERMQYREPLDAFLRRMNDEEGVELPIPDAVRLEIQRTNYRRGDLKGIEVDNGRLPRKRNILREDGMPLEGTQGDALWQSISRASQEVSELYDLALNGSNENKKIDLLPVADWEVKTVADVVSIDGYRHQVDMYAVKHSINQHGNESKEKSRGQVAITKDDIASIPEIVSMPDAIAFGVKNSRGQELIASMKRMADGTVLVVEEVPTGKKTLSVSSMRKYPGAKDFDSVARTLLSNARSDAGNPDLRIVESPQVVKTLNQSAQHERSSDIKRGFFRSSPDSPLREIGINLSMDELRGVYDSMRMLEHAARQITQVNAEGRKVEVAQAALSLSNMLFRSIKGAADMERKSDGAASLLDRVKDVNLDIPVLLPEFMFERFDGSKKVGPWHEFIWDRYNDAADRQIRLREMLFPKILGYAHANAIDRSMGKIHIDAINADLVKDDIIAIALNCGNESNLDKLMRGGLRFKGDKASTPLSHEALREILSHLSGKEIDVVNGIWKTIDTLKPEAAEQARKRTGVEPNWIEKMPMQIKNGKLDGGYYPVKYDPRYSAVGEKQSDSSALDQMFNKYAGSSVRQGYMEGRTSFAAPMSLDWQSIVSRHLDEVITDISHWQFATDTQRLLKRPEVKDAINDRLGSAYYKNLLDWVRYAVNQDNVSPEASDDIEKFRRQIRSNVSTYALGFKVANAVNEPAIGAPLMMQQVKIASAFKGIMQYMRNPVEATRFANEASEYMRNIDKSLDRDIAQALRPLAGPHSVADDIRHWSIAARTFFQKIGAVMAWHAGYIDAQEQGLQGNAAVRNADSICRMTQGAGRGGDASAAPRNTYMEELARFIGPTMKDYLDRVGINPDSKAWYNEQKAQEWLAVLQPTVSDRIAKILKPFKKIRPFSNEAVKQSGEQVYYQSALHGSPHAFDSGMSHDAANIKRGFFRIYPDSPLRETGIFQGANATIVSEQDEKSTVDATAENSAALKVYNDINVQIGFATLLAGYVANAMISGMISGKHPDKVDKLPAWILTGLTLGLFDGFPLMRDIAGNAGSRITGEEGKDLRQLPDLQWGKDAVDSITKTVNAAAGNVDWHNAIIQNAKAVGGATGLPTLAGSTVGQYIYDVLSGEYMPDHPWSPVTGIFHNHTKK